MQNYAAKVIHDSVENKTQLDVLNIYREVNLISGMNHPSVLKFIGYLLTNFSQEPEPTIVTECCNQRPSFLYHIHGSYKIWKQYSYKF